MDSASLLETLRERFATAIERVSGLPRAEIEPAVRPSGDPKFGDYQCNAAMGLGKQLGRKPREIAEQIVAATELSDLALVPEIAGPGFINVRLREEFLAARLAAVRPAEQANGGDRFGIPPTRAPQRVIVDYSSPNIAKQMHVGHVRSTIIGDVFARVLAFDGHAVTRINHIGDWGTAIGMVVLGLWYIEARRQRGETIGQIEQRLAALGEADAERLDRFGAEICRDWTEDLTKPRLADLSAATLDLDQLELGYRFVNRLIAVAGPRGWTVSVEGERCPITEIPRRVTAMLQKGGAANRFERDAWWRARAISLDYCESAYRRLGVLLSSDDALGESFYEIEARGSRPPPDLYGTSQRLAQVVAELRTLLPPRDKSRPADRPYAEVREDRGATCLFLYQADHSPQFKNPDGAELPMLIQKSDGAYLYATTDLASMRYRLKELGATRLIYIVGAPQKLHFQMLFAATRATGWADPRVQIEHVPFGMILGEDRKPLRTRSGENIKLAELLDEAERRALELIRAREAQAAAAGETDALTLDETQKQSVARHVGIAAVKYADLARDRNTDYVFSWDKLLALQGNTAPYLLYAYARIRSIYSKGAQRFGAPDVYAAAVALRLDHPSERALGLRLLRLREAIDEVAANLTPHTLCAFLYELAAEFMRFYEACPVLDAPHEAARLSRLRLCDLTARALALGLRLLGIDVLERM